MVLDQIVLATLLSTAPIAHAPSSGMHPVPLRSEAYELFLPPEERVFRDAPPIAYTDRFELRRPGRTYQNRR